jgi:hypothetical protein
MSKLIAFLICCFTLVYAPQGNAKSPCLGTFSNFTFTKEAGDLVGVEIKVVQSRSGYQGAIQFSEGEPGSLTVVPVKCNGTTLSFDVPAADGNVAAHFEGKLSKAGLDGVFKYDSGASNHATLPRRKGYWD